MRLGNGRKIDTVYTKTDPDTILIMTHGLGSSKQSQTYVALEEQLSGQMSILRFDMFAHGKSEGNMVDLSLEKVNEDFKTTIAFAQREGYENVYIVGCSLSGTSALYTGRYDIVKKVALKAPVLDYPKKIMTEMQEGNISSDGKYVDYKGKFTFTDDFVDAALKWRALDFVDEIKIPVLIVHGNWDHSAPLEDSKAVVEQLKHGKLCEIDKANHIFTGHEEEMILALVEFFKIE